MMFKKSILSLTCSVAFLTSLPVCAHSPAEPNPADGTPAHHPSIKEAAVLAKQKAAARKVALRAVNKASAQVVRADSGVQATTKLLDQLKRKEAETLHKLDNLQSQEQSLAITLQQRNALSLFLKDEAQRAKILLKNRPTPAQRKLLNDVIKRYQLADRDAKSTARNLKTITRNMTNTEKALSRLTQQRNKADLKLSENEQALGTAHILLSSLMDSLDDQPPVVSFPSLRIVLPEPSHMDANDWTSQHPLHNQLMNGPFNVPGDGDCFFYAMQRSRAEMVDLVIKNINHEDIRQALSLEIAIDRARHTKNWDEVNNHTYPLASSEELVKHTIHKYLKNKEFATDLLAKSCAIALNWNLYIWSQNNITKTLTMSPGSFVEQQSPERTVHVLLRGQHFYILVPDAAPLIEKQRAHEINKRTTAYIEASSNKAKPALIKNLKMRTYLPKNWKP